MNGQRATSHTARMHDDQQESHVRTIGRLDGIDFQVESDNLLKRCTEAS